MPKAIVLPYVCEQNEPSNPLPRVYDIPTDPAEQREVLTRIYGEVFPDLLDDLLEEGEELNIDEECEYGDLEVGDDCYLFITFIEE